VKKFTDRKTAVSRIWKAIQALGGALPARSASNPKASRYPAGAELPRRRATRARRRAGGGSRYQRRHPDCRDAHGQPGRKAAALLARTFAGLTPEQTESKWDALKSALAARPSVTARTPVAKSEGSREGSKTSQVIEMLKREGGATLKRS